MTESWSDQLIKKGLSDFLIEELEDYLSGEELESARKLLTIPVLNENDLETLKESIDSLSDELPDEYIDYLMEEVDEMEDDLEWLDSDKGKEIIAINDWAQPFYEEFRDMPEFENVMIGGHTEQSAILVTGKVKSDSDLERLNEYVNSKQPPFEVLVQVIVETE